jgi:hypothetical protein
MCGGSRNRAQREAQRAEDARMAAIRNTQASVNRAYDNPQRQADISDYVNSVRQMGTEDLNRQKGDTDRELKFALARNGLTGGSTQIDQQQRVAENYSRGLLEIDRKSRGAGAELQSQDQDNRARLIQLATSGLDATTGAQQAAAGMRSTLEAGRSTALAGSMGNAFADMQTFFDRTREAAGRRRANKETGFSPYQNPYGGRR